MTLFLTGWVIITTLLLILLLCIIWCGDDDDDSDDNSEESKVVAASEIWSVVVTVSCSLWLIMLSSWLILVITSVFVDVIVDNVDASISLIFDSSLFSWSRLSEYKLLAFERRLNNCSSLNSETSSTIISKIKI